jgi:hypothetical protein
MWTCAWRGTAATPQPLDTPKFHALKPFDKRCSVDVSAAA